MAPTKILVAVNASETSLRAVRYAVDIIMGREEFSVHILTVEQFPEADLFAGTEEWTAACSETRTRMREFCAQAKNLLKESGIAEPAISSTYIVSCHSPFDDDMEVCDHGVNITDRIIREVQQGGYGTLVVGRRETSREEEFLFGSVSNRLLHDVRNCAIWVVT